MTFKIGLIATEKMVEAFQIAGLSAKDTTVYTFNHESDVDGLRSAFQSLTARSDVGLILIADCLIGALENEVREYKKPLPGVLKIPSRR